MVRWMAKSFAGLAKQSAVIKWETSMRIVPLLIVRSAVTPDDTQVSAPALTVTQAVPEASPVPPLAPPPQPLQQPTIDRTKNIENRSIRRVAPIIVPPLPTWRHSSGG